MFWQIFIVVFCVILFITTFILNRKMKVDVKIDEADLPEDCMNCQNKTCLTNLKQQYDQDKINKVIDECNKGEKNNE